jgi:DNA-binding SARP family transcriptional activator
MSIQQEPSVDPGAVDSVTNVAAASISVQLLGGFRLVCGSEEVDLPLSAQRLIAFLALQQAPPLRLYVAGVLWPDTSEKRSYANLRAALCRARRPAPAIIEVRGATLRLAPGVTVDSDVAARLATDLLEHTGSQPPVHGIRLLSADLLPDWYDEWLDDEREAGLTALHGDRLRDTAHRMVIRTFIAQGNPAQAIRQYRSYERLLRRELGLAPSTQMQELVGSVPEFAQALSAGVRVPRRSKPSRGRPLRR